MLRYLEMLVLLQAKTMEQLNVLKLFLVMLMLLEQTMLAELPEQMLAQKQQSQFQMNLAQVLHTNMLDSQQELIEQLLMFN